MYVRTIQTLKPCNMNSLTFVTFMVSEKIQVQVLNNPSHLTDQKHVNLKFISTRFILCMIFLIYVSTIQHLNYSRQESKQESQKPQFVVCILVIKPTIKM